MGDEKTSDDVLNDVRTFTSEITPEMVKAGRGVLDFELNPWGYRETENVRNELLITIFQVMRRAAGKA